MSTSKLPDYRWVQSALAAQNYGGQKEENDASFDGRYLVSFFLLFIFLRKQWQTTIWQRQTIDNHYMKKTPSTYRFDKIGRCAKP